MGVSRLDDRLLAEACLDRGEPGPAATVPPVGLEASSGRVLAQAVHSSRASVLVTDADLDRPGPRIVYANPAFERMTGYGAHEVVGRDPRFLQGPATDGAVLARLRRDLEAGRNFEGEAVNYRADGTPFVMAWRIAPVLGPDGRASHFVAIQDDVTEDRLRSFHERRLVGNLQRGLLPVIPTRAGPVDLAVHYRPATPGFPLGGDWYDVVDRGGGAVALVVGDVAGHGVDAVASMGRLRWSVNALLAARTPRLDLADVVRNVYAMEDVYATLVVADVAADGSVRLATCGNPPVVVVRRDGSTGTVVTPNPMLGATTRPARVGVAEASLERGDALVLVTDGVLDGGRVPDDFGAVLERRLAGHADAALAELVRAVVADVGDDDDAAIIAAKVA